VQDLKTEVSKIVCLDSDNHIINISDAATGTVNQALPIIRKIIHTALQKYAAAIPFTVLPMTECWSRYAQSKS